jgi:hypothetical protein
VFPIHQDHVRPFPEELAIVEVCITYLGALHLYIYVGVEGDNLGGVVGRRRVFEEICCEGKWKVLLAIQFLARVVGDVSLWYWKHSLRDTN